MKPIVEKMVNCMRARFRQTPLSRYCLRRIPKIKPDEITRLQRAGILDQEALQEKVDGESGSMFQSLQASTQLSKPRLLQLIQQSLELCARPPLLRRSHNHAMDFFLVAVLLLFAAEFYFPPERLSHVIAARDIPPFQQIQSDDLREEPSRNGEHDTTDQYTGKYSLSRISKNSQLSGTDLVAVLVELRVEVKSTALADNATLSQPVLLVLSSRQPATGGVAIPALLSKIETNGKVRVATLQISSGQQSEAAKWLGSADAYIMLRKP